jgi:hypothetical protein
VCPSELKQANAGTQLTLIDLGMLVIIMPEEGRRYIRSLASDR